MITPQIIKQLREETGISIMECKKALEEAKGDFAKSKTILETRSKGAAQKKSERTIKEGTLGCYIHATGKVGVLVELGCETDFVAKNPEFKELSRNIAMHIAAMNPKYLKPEEIPQEIINEEKEIFRQEFAGLGKPDHLVEKMIEGKLKKRAEEISLLPQPYIKDQDKTIGDLINSAISKFGENIVIGKFVRFAL